MNNDDFEIILAPSSSLEQKNKKDFEREDLNLEKQTLQNEKLDLQKKVESLQSDLQKSRVF